MNISLLLHMRQFFTPRTGCGYYKNRTGIAPIISRASKRSNLPLSYRSWKSRVGSLGYAGSPYLSLTIVSPSLQRKHLQSYSHKSSVWLDNDSGNSLKREAEMPCFTMYLRMPAILGTF